MKTLDVILWEHLENSETICDYGKESYLSPCYGNGSYFSSGFHEYDDSYMVVYVIDWYTLKAGLTIVNLDLQITTTVKQDGSVLNYRKPAL